MAEKFTSANVLTVTRPEGRAQAIVWDGGSTFGLGILIGAKARTYICQREVNKRTYRATLGRVGEMSLKDARDAARRQFATFGQFVPLPSAIVPTAGAENHITLQQGLDFYLTFLREHRDPETARNVEGDIKNHLGDWLKRPLLSIRRVDCAQRHAKISKENGKYAANHTFSFLRTIYRRLHKMYDDFPAGHPVVGVDFNKTPRCQDTIENLPEWWQAVGNINNPIRRDLLKFLLFTGIRPKNAVALRWEYVDFQRGTIHIPKTKNTKPLHVPLSDYLLGILQQRRIDNPRDFGDDRGFVFPAKRSKTGHIHSPRQQVYVKDAEGRLVRDAEGHPRKINLLATPYCCKRKFLTVARQAGVDLLTRKRLVGHSTASDVTEGYDIGEFSELQTAINKVAVALLVRAGVKEPVAPVRKGA